MKFSTTYFIALLVLSFCSCSSGPKTLEPVNDSQGSETGVFTTEPTQSRSSTTETAKEIHTVEILETLETQKYSYLKVKEAGNSFWIATLKGHFKIGGHYHFTGGLLKKNFKSVEHNRIFDELYLVSNIVPLNHGEGDQNNASPSEKEIVSSDSKEVVNVEGSLKIAEIVEKAESLNGQTVQVSGRVVKVNPNIMDRSWIHLQDGSMDDYDLVVTTDKPVQVGQVVTFKALVTTNKDFGAGYSYELILGKG